MGNRVSMPAFPELQLKLTFVGQRSFADDLKENGVLYVVE